MTSINHAFLNAIEDITLEITNQCNLHCHICHIWKEKHSYSLTCADLQRFLSFFPHLNVVALTGGEASLHPEINNIYRLLYQMFLKNRHLNIDLATNAYGEELLTFLKHQKQFLHPLSLSISLDGIDDIHDQQRGTKGAFSILKKHLSIIQQYNIPITLKFVASSINYHQLLHAAIFAKKMHCLFSFKIIEELSSYYHRHTNPPIPLLTTTQKQKLQSLIKKLPSYMTLTPLQTLSIKHHLKFLHYDNLDHITSCQTPSKSLFITSQGNIYNCLYQPSIGTLKDFPQNLLHQQTQENALKGMQGKCPKCLSYHGFLRDYHT